VSIACDRRCCWSVNESGDESGSRLPSVIIRSDRSVTPSAFSFLSLSLAASPLSPTNRLSPIRLALPGELKYDFHTGIATVDGEQKASFQEGLGAAQYVR
jgi:hypothetical protein